MSNLPSIKRFYAEDYPNTPEWFNQFLGSLNDFTDPIYGILNGNVDVTNNTADEIYRFSFTAVSSTASLNTYTFFPKKFIGAPNGVVVGQCLVNASTVTPVGNPVAIDWVWTGSQVSIIAIYGLTTAVSYQFTLRIF